MAYGSASSSSRINVIPIWIIIISVASIAAMPVLVWAAARSGKMTVYKWCLFCTR